LQSIAGSRASACGARLSGTTTFQFQFNENELEAVRVLHVVFDASLARRNLTAFKWNGYVSILRFHK
jgi:hypothetical protein